MGTVNTKHIMEFTFEEEWDWEEHGASFVYVIFNFFPKNKKHKSKCGVKLTIFQNNDFNKCVSHRSNLLIVHTVTYISDSELVWLTYH